MVLTDLSFQVLCFHSIKSLCTLCYDNYLAYSLVSKGLTQSLMDESESNSLQCEQLKTAHRGRALRPVMHFSSSVSHRMSLLYVSASLSSSESKYGSYFCSHSRHLSLPSSFLLREMFRCNQRGAHRLQHDFDRRFSSKKLAVSFFVTFSSHKHILVRSKRAQGRRR